VVIEIDDSSLFYPSHKTLGFSNYVTPSPHTDEMAVTGNSFGWILLDRNESSLLIFHENVFVGACLKNLKAKNYRLFNLLCVILKMRNRSQF
jgi:hypothetical protein